MKNPPLHLAGCVIRNVQGEVLLLHRNKNDTQQWELPGGKLEPGENSKQAAARELQEELGVAVRVNTHLGQATFIEKERECVYDWYEAALESGRPFIGEPQTFDDLQYWDIHSLQARRDLSANLKNLLKSGVL